VLRRAAGALLLAGLAVLATAGSASAHALVKSSDPASGAILQTAPAQVVVMFTEPPDPALSFLHVLNSSGQSVTAGNFQSVPGNPLQLRVALQPLPNGVFTVAWRTVSKVDGHVIALNRSYDNLPANAKIEIGVRPEFVDAVAPAPGLLTTRIERIDDLGRIRFARVRVGEAKLAARAPAGFTSSDGTAGLKFDPSHVHVYADSLLVEGAA